MRTVPVHAKPDVHSGAHAHVGRDSGEQRVAAAPALGDCRDAVILRVQPSYHWPNEPSTSPVLRFTGPVRQPKARFAIASEPGLFPANRSPSRLHITLTLHTTE